MAFWEICHSVTHTKQLHFYCDENEPVSGVEILLKRRRIASVSTPRFKQIIGNRDKVASQLL